MALPELRGWCGHCGAVRRLRAEDEFASCSSCGKVLLELRGVGAAAAAPRRRRRAEGGAGAGVAAMRAQAAAREGKYQTPSQASLVAADDRSSMDWEAGGLSMH
ncbi:hypothetical protein C2845_PM06G22580 [Panicum miliaceum]|uniref:Uncharacterized protein n=1 Tax=Panicum miliaceum TaxID=4540 RepID=A0A3L6RE75_PANMI|nr:hypothetical protein C2845_PM06G22580 [Panicum miliaceum]